MSSASNIAAALGGKAEGRQNWRCRCPCCGSRCLSVSIGNGGLPLVYCFKSCTQDDVIAELRARGLWGRTDYYRWWLVAPRAPLGMEEKQQRAKALWDSATPGAECRQYFRARGITIPLSPTLKFSRQVWHPQTGEEADAIVALIEDIDRGPIGVHLIYLNENNDGKAEDLLPNKQTRGSFKGGAVQLGEFDPQDWLIIGEGIESTLSAMQLTGHPGWAALSTAGLRSVRLPSDARKIIIAADNDKNSVGQRAAAVAATRFQFEGRRVKVVPPDRTGDDWNDVLMRQRKKAKNG